MVSWFQGREITVEGHSGAKLLTSWHPGAEHKENHQRGQTRDQIESPRSCPCDPLRNARSVLCSSRCLNLTKLIARLYHQGWERRGGRALSWQGATSVLPPQPDLVCCLPHPGQFSSFRPFSSHAPVTTAHGSWNIHLRKVQADLPV